MCLGLELHGEPEEEGQTRSHVQTSIVEGNIRLNYTTAANYYYPIPDGLRQILYLPK